MSRPGGVPVKCPACGGEFSGFVVYERGNGVTVTRPRHYCGTRACNAKRARDWRAAHPADSAAHAGKAAEKRRENRASGRRTLIDPVTCERLYDDAEREFLMAMEAYRRKCKRPFPTWSEALQVLVSLGYRKTEQPGPLPGC